MTSPLPDRMPEAPRYTIGDIFDIPQTVHQGDFVLRLTEGVDADHAEATLRNYVATPQLVECFREALTLVRGALDAGTSRAAYLHGSFGAGKSHFMAVLSLLLDGNPRARALHELAPVVVDHQEWLGRKKVLVIPVHMINAKSLEAAVFGGYARFIHERHPDAPRPGFYRADRLFEDARSLRATMGDEVFFARLSASGGTGGGGWGALAGGWDAPAFEAALVASAGDPERARLVSDLVDTFFSSLAGLAGGGDEGYTAIDEGLVILTQHARAQGYDGVVFFLDEVMLWLASHAADPTFLAREAQKLVMLVETSNMRRAVPVVAFLARQRDLRQLVGEHLVGAEQQAIEDVLRFWEGRFSVIKLEDRNLPAIVGKRLLQPIGPEARHRLEEAFAQTAAVRAEVLGVLLTREGDREQFRQLYPFSPVLVQALVALSSLLQRERTALKLLVQLLVNQRSSLAVGDLMPVGDLWTVLSDGTEQPFSAAVRERFQQARRLWSQRFLPLLEEERQAAVQGGAEPEVAEQQFRSDQRLLATLILSALADGVEALANLTPQRLAALNHGTIRTRIPGQEARQVLDKLRRWAGRVGEIKLVEGATTQAVSLHLVGVNTDAILENARAADSMGARIQKVRAILFEQAGISTEDALVMPVRTVRWRGTERKVEVLFTNVRSMAPEQFRPSGQAPWRLVIDYPFDEPGQSPVNDRATILQASAAGVDAQAVAWIPSFLTPAALDELGKLVVLDFLLTGNQLDAHAPELSALDRVQAKEILKSQRDALRATVANALLSAYGITTQFRDRVDESHGLDTHLYTLVPGLTLAAPVGATFSEALNHVVGQALTAQFPAHPMFEGEVRPATLKKVWQWVQRAAQQPAGRVEVDRPDRDDMRRLAVPLQLGALGDAHFALERHWEQHFGRCQAQDGVTALTVERVRRWIDTPQLKGLPREAENLVILTWALQTNRTFHLHGSSATVEGSVDRLLDECEIRAQTLPDEITWRTAGTRAAELLGITAVPNRTAQAVAMLARDVGECQRERRTGVQEYLQRLDAALTRLGVSLDSSERRKSVQAAQGLMIALEGQNSEGIIRALASCTIPTTPTAVGESIARGADLARVLQGIEWGLADSLAELPRDLFGARAEALREGLRDALRRDEHVQPLEGAIRRFRGEALRLIMEATATVDEARRKEEERRREDERRQEERRQAEQAALDAERARLAGERAAMERRREEDERRAAAARSGHLVVTSASLEAMVQALRDELDQSPGTTLEVSWRRLGDASQ